MSGVLYIVATPIGNLDDITLRAIEVLGSVDLVAAEDTRHSQHLMAHLGLRKKMLSLHEHNEQDRVNQILGLLAQGQQIALVSDAGTPLISDPGFPLVRAVIEAGYKVTPIPGVSSIIAALSAAGLATDSFSYHGFLAHKNADRLTRLQALKKIGGTHVLLESTHRIERLLEQIDELMPASQLVLAKELTKRHESFIRGTAQQCLQIFSDDPLRKKGEFVVLMYHPAPEEDESVRLNAQKLLQLLMAEMPLKKAVKLAVEISGGKKNELYRQALLLSENEQT
ncbi:MAG: 16S rRNA (cytidine(1402)-2'-O)-methyltransferase [Gammaproteobacteria bacterium]|nr:16S rRNA (cytidine(1402)-2'-O)-methyltransferase [Gammaproteobacteria bacterium]MBL6999992.1 16S rRNA (cytidine(1402)-2'-O)-methyltransferase [Gammaproteobacteria bacterium]